MLRKIYLALSAVRAAAIVIILAAIIALCAVQIVLRYLTSTIIAPFAWGDEIIRLSSIWVVFLAASLGVRESSHLSVDFFVNRFLADKWVTVLKKAATVIVLVVLAAITYYGAVQVKMNIPSMLENLPFSRAWFYAAIPVGCLYLFIDYTIILVHGSHPFARKASGDGDDDPDQLPTSVGEV